MIEYKPTPTEHEETADKDYAGCIMHAVCCDMTAHHAVFSLEDGSKAAAVRRECPASLSPGDSVDIYIEGMGKNGLWLASIDKVLTARLLQAVDNARTNGTDLDAEVIAAENGGLVCSVLSMAAFIPHREIEDSPLPDLDAYIGKSFKVRILKFAKGTLIVSHKAAIAVKMRESREQLLAQLKPDQIYEGTVRQITDFGAFVDIGAGVEGLVHRTNLSWGGNDPSSVVSLLDKIKVVVLSVEKGRIALGRKQLIGDPWAEAENVLKIGDNVYGKVTTFANFGVFVHIEHPQIHGGIDGLIHRSELSWNANLRSPKQVCRMGETLTLRIIGMDAAKRRLSLSLRALSESPWNKAAEMYPVGSVQTLPVAGISDFGLFVDLGSGIHGLIHKSDLSWNDPGSQWKDNYHVGDSVTCKVISIDPKKERASLSIRKLSDDPWEAFAALKPVGKQFPAVIKRIAEFGAFAELERVEGLIHRSEISENRINSVADAVSVGQNVTVTVITLDKTKHRIGLSLIADPFVPDEEEPPVYSDSTPEQQATLADILPANLLLRRGFR